MKKLKSSQYINLTKNKHEQTGSNLNCPVYSSGGRDISREGWDIALCMFHGQQNTAAAKCSETVSVLDEGVSISSLNPGNFLTNHTVSF